MAAEVNYCGPCLREETKVPAFIYCLECSESLCENCNKFHRKVKSLSSHALYNICDPETDTDKLDFLTSMTKCSGHEAEVQYICKDHDQLCCNECAIVKHRRCHDIVSLSDEITSRGSTGLETNKKLDEIEKGAETLMKYENERKSSVRASVEQVEKKLLKIQKLLDEAFRQLRQTATCDVEEKSRNILGEINVQVEGIQTLTSAVDQSRKKLKFVRENGEKVHLFLVERVMETELKRHEETLQTLRRRSSVRNVTVIEDITDKELLKTISSCFHIEEETSRLQLPACVAETRQLKDMEPELAVEEKLMLSKCNICSCIWIDNSLVVVLHEIEQIRLFTVENDVIKHSTTKKTSSRPWSLAEIDNLKFAVCFPFARTIEIMKVFEGSFQTLKTINTGTDIWDISFDKSRSQIIGLSRSGSVDIYNLAGVKSRSLPLTSTALEAVKRAYSVCFDTERDVLYISSHELHKLLAIRLNGSALFEYSSPKLKFPWHPDLDRDGNIYLPFFNSDGGMGAVHQIDNTGRLIREIKLPGHGLCVCFDKTKTKLLISCSKRELLVLVYHFK